MSKQRSIIHHTFTVERTFSQTQTKVYLAFAKKELKERWFIFPDDTWHSSGWLLDFHEQSTEICFMHPPSELDAPMITYRAYFLEMLAFERIVYTYNLHYGSDHISYSLVTIELRPEGKGTRLVLTEQGAFLDGHESPELRVTLVNGLMDRLGASLES